MHAIIPLLFILILFNGEQLKKDKLYRANVFALIGTSYFFLLQYTIYWYRIFPSQSFWQFIPGFVVVLSTIAIALSKWNKRSHPAKTTALCLVFSFSLLLTFTLDKLVKEKLAEIGGYFKDGSLSHRTINEQSALITQELPEISLQLKAPKSWQIRTLPSGHHFFIKGNENNLLLEFRPNCLGEAKLDTPTLLQNSKLLFEANASENQSTTKCIKNERNKECILKVTYPASENKFKEKWRWIKIGSSASTSALIDIVFTQDTDELKDEAWAVLQSVQVLKTKKSMYCTTPAAWL